jgi:hypothetical protein
LRGKRRVASQYQSSVNRPSPAAAAIRLCTEKTPSLRNINLNRI